MRWLQFRRRKPLPVVPQRHRLRLHIPVSVPDWRSCETASTPRDGSTAGSVTSAHPERVSRGWQPWPAAARPLRRPHLPAVPGAVMPRTAPAHAVSAGLRQANTVIGRRDLAHAMPRVAAHGSAEQDATHCSGASSGIASPVSMSPPSRLPRLPCKAAAETDSGSTASGNSERHERPLKQPLRATAIDSDRHMSSPPQPRRQERHRHDASSESAQCIFDRPRHTRRTQSSESSSTAADEPLTNGPDHTATASRRHLTSGSSGSVAWYHRDHHERAVSKRDRLTGSADSSSNTARQQQYVNAAKRRTVVFATKQAPAVKTSSSVETSDSSVNKAQQLHHASVVPHAGAGCEHSQTGESTASSRQLANEAPRAACSMRPCQQRTRPGTRTQSQHPSGERKGLGIARPSSASDSTSMIAALPQRSAAREPADVLTAVGGRPATRRRAGAVGGARHRANGRHRAAAVSSRTRQRGAGERSSSPPLVRIDGNRPADKVSPAVSALC